MPKLIDLGLFSTAMAGQLSPGSESKDLVQLGLELEQMMKVYAKENLSKGFQNSSQFHPDSATIKLVTDDTPHFLAL